MHPQPPYIPNGKFQFFFSFFFFFLLFSSFLVFYCLFLLAFPPEIHDIVAALHGNPPVWWIGQLMTYLMRPNEYLKRVFFFFFS